ncbi:MAG TPA: hypothetical protein VKB05_07125 [Pyrinomonadaceae bacterium]|nr:hypothetical protein [Pyrinomonadaceae bacterium]
MKRCPTCNRTYTDSSLNFCLEDGTPLTTDTPPVDPNATIRYPAARDTAEPPPTEIYRPQQQVVTPRPATAPPPPPPPTQWTPPPSAPPPRKKSNAVWWILGGLAAVLVIGVGLVVMVIALASLGSNGNTNNLNANTRNENRNSNVTANTNANANVSNTNANANVAIPNSLVDDFSQEKWRIGSSDYGRFSYDGGEYHMSGKAGMYVVVYAPSDEYSTENATVKVTARSVNGDVPASGFGLMVHCAVSKTKQLEDYALLIYPSDQPAYEIIKHKNGTPSSVVTKTESSAIRSGSAPNLLEVRIRGTELSFYANGQFLTKINDTENYKHGRTGFYTSDVYEVAFDDLSINR